MSGLPPGFEVEFLCAISSVGVAVWDGQEGDPAEVAVLLEGERGPSMLDPHGHTPVGLTVTNMVVTPRRGAPTNWTLARGFAGLRLRRDGYRAAGVYDGTEAAVEAVCRWHTEQHGEREA